MKQNNPRIDRLNEMIALEQKRTDLQQQLDAIFQRMTSLGNALFSEGGDVVGVSVEEDADGASNGSAKRRARTTTRGRGGRTGRGELRDRIVTVMKEAGSDGVKVQELAQQLSIKPANVHAWFHAALKRYPEAIEKLSGAHYRLVGTIGSSETSTQGEDGGNGASKPARGSRNKRAKGGSGRGELTRQIMEALQEAGGDGITVQALADRLKKEYRNVYVWFSTTGKRMGGLEKMGPAHYRLAAN